MTAITLTRRINESLIIGDIKLTFRDFLATGRVLFDIEFEGEQRRVYVKAGHAFNLFRFGIEGSVLFSQKDVKNNSIKISTFTHESVKILRDEPTNRSNEYVQQNTRCDIRTSISPSL